MKTNQTRITILAILSYLGPLCFVPLMNRDSEFVHAHAKQGLVLWAFSNMLFVLVFIPAIGLFLVKSLLVVLMVLSIAGVMSVLFNKKINLPIVSYLAKLI